MYRLLLCLLCVPVALRAQLADGVRPVYECHPVLPVVFFDSGSAQIPSRYHLFTTLRQTSVFSEDSLAGGTLERYYHVLNVIGSRLRTYPNTRVRITGSTSFQASLNETVRTANERGRVVRDYLRDVWGVDSNRIEIVAARDLPTLDGSRDPRTRVEARRVDIHSDDFEIVRPIPAYSPARTDDTAEVSVFSLIHFKFDSPEGGATNERILMDFVYERIRSNARLYVVGHSDIVGLEDRNMRLTELRAAGVAKRIRENVPANRYASLESRGTGEYEPLYDNDLPEGRYLNRTVQIIAVTPRGGK